MLGLYKISFFCAFLLVGTYSKKPANNHDSSGIIGGEVVRDNKYPYLAHYLISKNGGTYSCGGSIIHPKLILTAAHCVCDGTPQNAVRASDINDLLVGITNLDEIDWEKTATANVEKIIIHEGYDQSKTYNNDLAILVLKTALPMRPTIQPIKIVETVPKNEFAGQRVRLLGWGATSQVIPYTSHVLNYVDMTALSRKTCFARMLKYGFHPLLNKRMICYLGDTEEEGQGAGDSGGPSVILGKTPAEDRLLGVASWSMHDHRAVVELGSVQSLVPAFIDWIRVNLQKEGYCVKGGKVETCA